MTSIGAGTGFAPRRVAVQSSSAKNRSPGALLSSDAWPELLTLPRAARRAGLGTRQLRRATVLGELATYQVGKWPRVRWHEVVRWINARRVPPTSHAKRRVAEILAREARSG